VPPQVPPTDAVYPAFGVTVKDVVDPWFTVCTVAGLIVPPAPADGVTVYCFTANVALTVQAPVMALVV